MHGFESVVGPVKGVFDKETSLNKAREHSLLRSDRPAYVTILSLGKAIAKKIAFKKEKGSPDPLPSNDFRNLHYKGKRWAGCDDVNMYLYIYLYKLYEIKVMKCWEQE